MFKLHQLITKATSWAFIWMIKRALEDGWETDRALEEAKSIGLTRPEAQQAALNYIKAHKK